MKRLTYISISVIVIILAINFFYYTHLYNKQIEYAKRLLVQQVFIVGSGAEDIDFFFTSDLDRIFFTEQANMDYFFENPVIQQRIVEKLKLFYSKYQDLVTYIKVNNNQNDVYTFFKTSDQSSEREQWIDNQFVSRSQEEITPVRLIKPIRSNLEIYLPILSTNGEIFGNIIITINHVKYFEAQFAKYRLDRYQWQWLIDNTGIIKYNNFLSEDPQLARNPEEDISIDKLKSVQNDIKAGFSGTLHHTMNINGKPKGIVSAYFPVHILHKEFGLFFSAPLDFYKMYYLRNAIITSFGTVLLILVLIFLYRQHIKKLQEKKQIHSNIDEIINKLPLGLVLKNMSDEILIANKASFKLLSYNNISEIRGKPFSQIIETSNLLLEIDSSKLGIKPNELMHLKKNNVDKIVIRKEAPIIYSREKAIMIILIDIELLDIAPIVTKSAELALMSNELQSPLGAINALSKMLLSIEQTPKVRDTINLIEESTEIVREIANDLDDFTKVRSFRKILNEKVFNIRDAVNYCIKASESQLSKDVIIKCEIDPSIPKLLIGDNIKFRQVLLNLIFISRLHTQKGEINIRCNNHKSEKDCLFLKFQFSDTGSQYSNIVFKEISDNSTILVESIRNKSGIISKQLIELMDGELTPITHSNISNSIDSPKASFEFTVKLYTKNIEKKKAATQGIKSYGDIRTLVIGGENERDNQLMEALDDIGLITYLTSWKKQTIELIKSSIAKANERYNFIILLDSDKFDAHKAGLDLWESKVSDNVVILMLSSNHKKGNYAKCLSHRIDDYIAKPYDINMLQDIINARFPNVIS